MSIDIHSLIKLNITFEELVLWRKFKREEIRHGKSKHCGGYTAHTQYKTQTPQRQNEKSEHRRGGQKDGLKCVH